MVYVGPDVSQHPLNSPVARHGNCYRSYTPMEWYWRLTNAVMLLASGVVSIIVVERLHDLRRPHDISRTETQLLLSGAAAAPLLPIRLAPRSSSPAAVFGRGTATVIEGKSTKRPSARCAACTGTQPDELRDETCW